ncbi:redoxin domain-containing protein [Dyella soli]|nr:redoxin domain-containing protein [Dyella soli]
MTSHGRLLLSVLAWLAWAIALAGPADQSPATAATTGVLDLPVEGRLPSLDGATGWVDSPRLSPTDLHGKVVLVDFWTYSCINSIRQFPYVRAWAQKYRDQGLVVIGVHSPEFAFERDAANVRQALVDLHIGPPVHTAIDSRHGIWQAFDNAYWPALYFIDARGNIRHHVFGEGEYDKSERVIQQLLREAGASNVSRDLVVVDGRGVEAAPDWDEVKSPESYVGSERRQNFVSTGGSLFKERSDYAVPAQLSLNHWALAGDWTVQPQSAVLNKPNGRIVYRFHARDLNLVMGPAAAGTPVRFRVLIDGKPPGAAHGDDTDENGYGKVTKPRMYQLLRQPPPISEREFTIEFLDPGVESFVFTFG